VNHILLVRGLEGLTDLPRDSHRFFGGKRAAVKPLRECLAFDQFHEEEVPAAGLLHPVERGDMRVVERGEDFGFAFQSRDAIGIEGELFRKNLQRDFTSQFRVARAIDLAHATSTKRCHDFIRPETSSDYERHGLGVNIFSLALGPHPQRELTLMPSA